ncbi:hypothetical protein GGF46_001100 [Coemansia sp. RSA 552]|nr:hypothetical protein GGF46_001100 [Coemansia sp. RSA 552]
MELERPTDSSRLDNLPTEAAALARSAKLRAATWALVQWWGSTLTGAAVRELNATATGVHAVSVLELPHSFCVAPADEPLSPSDDPARVIVIVSARGMVLDAGVFNSAGAVFYRGHVLGSRYMTG